MIPQYSVRPASATEAAAATAHINLMYAIVLWVVAAEVVLVYGPSNLSRKPRQVLSAVRRVQRADDIGVR